MPRRAVLSDEQRAALLALPDDETLLIQHWTLSQDDLAVIVGDRTIGWASRSSIAPYDIPGASFVPVN
jgi:hypothetical protein